MAGGLRRDAIRSRRPAVRRRARELFGTVLLSVLMLVGLRAAFGNFVVDGPSMEPTLVGGERIWVTRLDELWTKAPARGDIVVFQAWGQSEPFVKRVIGLPGEAVEVRDDQVWIDGQPLVEPYLHEVTSGSHGPLLLGERELFVLGDNRDQSADSRSYGPLPMEALTGTARMRYWPPDHVSLLGWPRPALAGEGR